MNSAVILLTMFPDIKAARAAVHTLVEERLVACGNIAGGIESIYTWKGNIETGHEVLVILKTAASAAPAAQERLRGLHPYEVPEILVLPAAGGAQPYLAWIAESVGARA